MSLDLFDTNAWVGEWPFTLVANRDAAALKRYWKKHGIDAGLVSSFAALWVLDPMPANRALRADIGTRKGMTVLPIVNGLDPDWRGQLQEIASWPEVRAVRLAPSYGGWSLTSWVAKDLSEAILGYGLKIVLTARLVDERQEHPALRVKPLEVPALTKWLRVMPSGEPLIQGLTRWDIEALAEESDRFLTDFSYAEWENSLGVVRAAVGPKRMVLGTATPLLSTNAQVNKVVQSPETLKVRQAVGSRNAARFLSYDQRWE
jgi:hypothetical protein